MIKTKFFLVVLVLTLQGCCIQKRTVQEDFDINGVEERLKTNDTLTLLVLSFAPAEECNDSIHWYSTCFGLDTTTDKVVRVYSECNKDTSIRAGSFIRVIPENTKEKGNYKVVMATRFRRVNREYKYSPLYKIQPIAVTGSVFKLQ